MAPDPDAVPSQVDQLKALKQIQVTLQSIQRDNEHLSAAVDAIHGRVNILAGIKQVHDTALEQRSSSNAAVPTGTLASNDPQEYSSDVQSAAYDTASPRLLATDARHENVPTAKPSPLLRGTGATTSRIILTTYPGQSGIDPLVMNWGHVDPLHRGPVIVSRAQSTIRRRNGT